MLGVHHIGMLWRIYLSNQESRTTLLTQHITIGELSIEYFSNNPLRAGLKKGEHDQDIIRIVIKVLPLSKGNSSSEEFLGANNVTLRRPIQNGKLRDKNNILLNVYSGDRIIYDEKFATPLPRRAKIGDSISLIYHEEQSTESSLCTNYFQRGHLKKRCTNQTACMLCKASDHKAGDSGCIAKQKPHTKV